MIGQKLYNGMMIGLKSYFPYLLGEKTERPVNKDIHNLANFASISYKQDRPKHIEGFGDYDKSLSNEYHSVYKNPESKNIYLGIRGTKMNDVNDLKADVGIFVGNTSAKRFEDANNLVKQMKQQYPEYKITSIGHSLGGAISKEITKNNPEIQSYTFNAGSSPFGKNEKVKNAIDVRKTGDIISAFNKPNNTGGDYNSSFLAGHSIKNF